MFSCSKYHVTERGPYGGGSGRKHTLRLYRLFGLPIFWTRKPASARA